jgi:Lon protease-like protein
VRLLERLIAGRGRLVEPPHDLASAGWVGSRLAELLPLPLDAKQELLELDDGRERLERINALLSGAAAAP